MKIIIFVQFFVFLVSQFIQVSHLTNYKTIALQFLSRELLEETKELKGDLVEYFKKLRNYEDYNFCLVTWLLSFLQFLWVSHLTNYKTIALQFLSREILEETKELKGHLGEYFKKLRNYKNFSFYLVFCFLGFFVSLGIPTHKLQKLLFL